MNGSLFEKLHTDGWISDRSFSKIKAEVGIFSIHRELKMLLYLGIVLLTTGLGILVYKNIDSIGHTAILLLLAIISSACLYYCFRNSPGYAPKRINSSASFGYILLLGCLSMLIFVAYLQFQFHIFGEHYGLATFFPMLFLMASAYYFDHIGVLSLGISNFAAWAGISITPLHLLENDFATTRIIYTGIALGLLLILAGESSQRKNVKAHFAFTYINFGFHLLLVSLLAALFTLSWNLLWFCLTATACFYFYRKAQMERSFYFLLLSVIYGYIALSYVVLNNLVFMSADVMMIGLLYLIFSGIGTAVVLIRANKKLKSDDRVS
ncbi:MAG: hypothetical protein JWQ27_1608 [Ferruginibacter sp.]|nr:hypothetical protein [Ferruginibacter sp.]